MEKRDTLIKSVLITLVIMIILLFPVTTESTIVKHEINSIKPMSCQVNGQYVGAEIVVGYWLEREKMPDTLKIEVTRPFVLGALGSVYKVKKIN